ncbi:hypothetical protein [Petrachloros mirabilis]
MRYYDLIVTQPGSGTAYRQWTSHPKGQFDPYAWNIEFDIPIAPGNVPIGAHTITIQGVSLQDLTQANQFAGMQLQFRAGMAAGLPLANPKQAGLIEAGYIFQSFGNWEGTEMTLDFVIYPPVYTFQSPGNIVLNWKANSELSTALKTCLSTAYPGIPIIANLTTDMVQNFDEVAMFSTFEQLAQWVTQLTEKRTLNPVYIVNQGGQIYIYDLNSSQGAIQIQFNDLVGQPTWIEPNTMQVKMILRADIQVGSLITMPQGIQDKPGFVLTAASSLPSSIKYKTAFQGNFFVKEMRHIGNYRTPDGASWVTIMNCTVA